MAYTPTINTKWYWKLDGNSLDSSGLGNNGTDTAISYVAGRVGQAASFNGSSSQIYKDSASFDFYWTQNITFSCWVKPSALPSSSTYYYHPIAIQEAATQSTVDKSIKIFGDGSVAFFVYDWAAKYAKSATWLVSINNWYHLLWVYNGTNAILYSNGVQVWTITASWTFNFTTPRLCMSHYSGEVDSKFFNWLIDEVIIEDRAWSATEVRNYYSSFYTANAVWRTRYRDELGQVDSVGAFA